MAVIKIVNSSSPLAKGIDYIKRKAPEELQAGKDLNPKTALEEMESVKNQYNKNDGRQYQHAIQSFDPEDKVTPEQAHKLGQEFMERNPHWQGHQVIMTTHTDQKHIHNHFIINSVNHENGYKLQTSKQDYQKMKDLSNEISKENNLTIPEKNPDRLTSFNQEKYQALKKGYEGKEPSYLLDTYKAVNKSASQSVSRSDFISNMEKEGYKTNWTDTRKHITFTNPEGKKVRLANLEKTFKDNTMTKGSLENGFERNQKDRNIRERLASRYASPSDSTRQQDNELHKHPEQTDRRNEQGLQRNAESTSRSLDETRQKGRSHNGRTSESDKHLQKSERETERPRRTSEAEPVRDNQRSSEDRATPLARPSENLQLEHSNNTRDISDNAGSSQVSQPSNFLAEITKAIANQDRIAEQQAQAEQKRIAHEKWLEKDMKKNPQKYRQRDDDDWYMPSR